jgi:hypothetical protein
MDLELIDLVALMDLELNDLVALLNLAAYVALITFPDSPNILIAHPKIELMFY